MKHVIGAEKVMIGMHHYMADIVVHQLLVVVNISEDTSSDDHTSTDEVLFFSTSVIDCNQM